ncbi:MAG: hypothetical protein AB7O88_27905 [Reyranellaceae bacterium]
MSTRFRAALVEEIDTARNLNGKPPDDAALREMVWRSLPATPVHNIIMPRLNPETIDRMARGLGQVLDAATLFTMWLFLDGAIQQMKRLHPPSPPAPNIVTPRLDPETARRVANLPGYVLDELSLFMMWLLLNGRRPANADGATAVATSANFALREAG